MHPELPPVPGSSGGESSSSVANRRRIAKMASDGRMGKGPLNLVSLENGTESEAAASVNPMLQRRRRQPQNLLIDQDPPRLPTSEENGVKSRSRGSIG